MILIKPSFKILTDTNYDMLRRIERAGRTCYKSEAKITQTSCSDFVRKIIKSGHESVLEHEFISICFVVDRGVSHELVRHRLASFSQESTRYCNYKGGVTFVIPPWVEIEPGAFLETFDISTLRPIDKFWFASMLMAQNLYMILLEQGWSPQQARSVLPNSLKTEIVMTANLREWRHILKLRTDKAAHPQMREIMCPLLDVLKEELPEVFGDINYK